jgi:hypothetical protein
MQQLLYVDPSRPPQIVNLGPASGGSLRTWIDSRMRDVMDKQAMDRQHGESTGEKLLHDCRARRKTLDAISRRRADMYQRHRHAGFVT